jgi:hypothetical protein
MPRYFFHLHNDEISVDEEGRELADLAAARATALEAARGLAGEAVSKGEVNLDDHIDIADADGAILYTLTFREAFTIKG